MGDTPNEIDPGTAARLMRNLDPQTRNSLIVQGAAAGKVIDLRPRLEALRMSRIGWSA
jgi:hypothetical protein